MKLEMFIVSLAFILQLPSLSVQRGTWNSSGSYEYYVSKNTERGSYDSSLKICNNHDGSLALVKSQQIQSFIESLVANGSGMPYGFFIGLNDIYDNNTYAWIDGSAINYTEWMEGEPNNKDERCVIMGWVFTYHTDLHWYNMPCDGKGSPTGFVCQRNIGLYWTKWRESSSCNCSGIELYNRTCINSTRPGPYECSVDKVEYKTQSCSDIPLECYTTSTLLETTADHLTTTVDSATPTITDQSTRTSGAASTFISSSTTIADSSTMLYIVIGGAGGGVLILVIVIAIICIKCAKSKRKVNNKNEQSNASIENKRSKNELAPDAESEYSTIAATNVEASAEGEYTTMNGGKPVGRKTISVSQNKSSVKFTNKHGSQRSATKSNEVSPDEYATIPKDMTKAEVEEESEYTVMQTTKRRKHEKSPSQRNQRQLQTVDEKKELDSDKDKGKQNNQDVNAGELYAAVIPKANRVSVVKKRSTRNSKQNQSTIKPESPNNDGTYSSIITTSNDNPTDATQMYDALNLQGTPSIKGTSKSSFHVGKNSKDTTYEETILKLKSTSIKHNKTTEKLERDHVEEATYASVNDATNNLSPQQASDAKILYSTLSDAPNSNAAEDGMYDALKI